MSQIAKSGIAAFLFAVLTLTACSQTNAPQQESSFIAEESEVEAQWGQSVESDDFSIISEVELDNGNVVRFIDEQLAGEALNVGVVELIRADAGSAVSGLTAAGELSPLELYLSLSKQRDAPEQLVLHHEALAKASASIPTEPRTVGTAGVATQAEQLKGCWKYGESRTSTNFYLHFRAWVEAAFSTPPANFGVGRNLTSTHYGVTGVSSKRALSTCNAGRGFIYPSIQVQYARNAWLNVPIDISFLGLGEAVFYYSGSNFAVPTRYRIRVWMPFSNSTAHTMGSW